MMPMTQLGSCPKSRPSIGLLRQHLGFELETQVSEYQDHYVYILFRPWDGSPCYVGKGRLHRWKMHENSGANHPNKSLAAVYARAGGPIPKVKCREALTNAEAFETEIALIRAIGRGELGPLVNKTNGGDGASGNKHTPESRAKISATKKKNMTAETRAKIGAGHKGIRLSEETKKKLSAAATGRKSSMETRLKQSISRKGRTWKRKTPVSDSHRKNISAALRGKKYGRRTKEWCESIKAAKRARDKERAEAVFYKGERITIGNLAERVGLSYGTLRARIKKGADIESAVTLPLCVRNSHRASTWLRNT